MYLENIDTLSANALSASTTLANLTLKDSNVPNYFCANCKTVNNVSMTNGTIGQHAFLNCVGLKNLTITGVTSIDKNAFDGCTGLTTLSFPTSLTEIGI